MILCVTVAGFVFDTVGERNVPYNSSMASTLCSAASRSWPYFTCPFLCLLHLRGVLPLQSFISALYFETQLVQGGYNHDDKDP